MHVVGTMNKKCLSGQKYFRLDNVYKEVPYVWFYIVGNTRVIVMRQQICTVSNKDLHRDGEILQSYILRNVGIKCYISINTFV